MILRCFNAHRCNARSGLSRDQRNKSSAPAFERKLRALDDELRAQRCQPSTSPLFFIAKPKHAEIFAAAFRERIVPRLV